MNIRPATIKDVREVRRFMEGLGYYAKLSLLEEQVKDMESNKDHYVLVCDLENEFAGFCAVHFIPQLGFDGGLAIITFLSVKNSTASRPCACITPKKLPFHPEKGKYAIGAGTPMLIPTLPVETELRNLRADAPEEVKMELAFP